MLRSGWTLNSAVVACLTLAMSLLATAGAWYLAKSLADEDAQHRFEQRAIGITNAIADRMLDYEQVLRGAVGLFAASQSVGRAEWRAYVEPIKLEQSYPGFQGIGFAKWVPAQEKDAHVDRIRAEGFFDYAVSPPGERAEYVPAVYLEPFSERNLWAFGYDMFSEPTRRAAMERARDTGSATSSGKVTLEQETAHDLQAGFLMYLPVYRNGARTESVEQRRSALIGYVYSPFRVNDLMRGILRGQTNDVAIDIFDGAGDSESARMYGSHGSRLPMFMRETTVAVAGEVWTLRVSSLPAFEAAVEEDTPEIVFTSGLFISALLLTLTLTLVNRRAAATQMAKEMTLSLRESEAKFRSVAESAHEAIIIIDADGKVVSWNRGAEHIFGYEAEEIVGRELLLLMPVRFREQHREGLARVRTGGEARVIGKTVEFAGLNKAGREFPLELSLAAWETGSGRFYSGIVRDISKRKAAERKADELTASLRAKEDELRAVVENVADGIIVIDEAGVMLEANRAACEIFRFSPSEILGKKLHELIPEVRTHKPEKVEHRRREMVGRRSDNSEFPLELSYGGEQIEVGGKVLYTGAVRDISERKAAERMKSEFIATVSHELRTPLTAIIGSLGLVRSEMLEELPGPAKKFVIMAHQNSERLAALINDILDIEKIEGGYITFRLEPVELRDCLRQSIEMCGGYADQFGVQCELREPLPRVKLRADRDRLAQVLANLLSNAAKFSPRGGRVQIAATANDGIAKVAVSDRGPGVPEEFVGRLFGKFAQADSSTTRVKGGTGLGLSISRMLVEKMGGKIGYERNAEGGATFYFELPLWQERAPVVGEPGGPQILLCEDERDTATLIGDMLAREGYTVHIAYSAALARQLLASHKCAAMILDLSLPDEDGVQLVKSLRAASVKLPIIIASERASVFRAELRDEDIADWLDKPFTREQLVKAVRRALARPSRDKEWATLGPVV